MGPVGAYVFLSDCLTHECRVTYLKALTHLYDAHGYFARLNLHCGIPCVNHAHFLRALVIYLGRLQPQGIRCSFSGSLERDREKKNYFCVEDLTWDSLVVELPPHVHLGGAITDTSKTSGIPSWKRGLLQMDNIYFVDEIWFGTVPWQYNACYIMH